jgi:transposase
MTRDEKITEAHRLKNTGLGWAEIARRLDVTASCVFKWLNPDRQREYRRRHDRGPKRDQQKRAWNEAHRAVCVECGELTGIGAYRSERCSECQRAKQRRELERRRAVVREGYAKGIPLREIASQLDVSPQAVANLAHRMRRDGLDVAAQRLGRRPL